MVTKADLILAHREYRGIEERDGGLEAGGPYHADLTHVPIQTSKGYNRAGACACS